MTDPAPQASLDSHIKNLVAQAPPMTDAQRDCIAALLRPGAARRQAAA